MRIASARTRLSTETGDRAVDKQRRSLAVRGMAHSSRKERMCRNAVSQELNLGRCRTGTAGILCSSRRRIRDMPGRCRRRTADRRSRSVGRDRCRRTSGKCARSLPGSRPHRGSAGRGVRRRAWRGSGGQKVLSRLERILAGRSRQPAGSSVVTQYSPVTRVPESSRARSSRSLYWRRPLATSGDCTTCSRR